MTATRPVAKSPRQAIEAPPRSTLVKQQNALRADDALAILRDRSDEELVEAITTSIPNDPDERLRSRLFSSFANAEAIVRYATLKPLRTRAKALMAHYKLDELKKILINNDTWILLTIHRLASPNRHAFKGMIGTAEAAICKAESEVEFHCLRQRVRALATPFTEDDLRLIVGDSAVLRIFLELAVVPARRIDYQLAVCQKHVDSTEGKIRAVMECLVLRDQVESRRNALHQTYRNLLESEPERFHDSVVHTVVNPIKKYPKPTHLEQVIRRLDAFEELVTAIPST